MRLDSSSAIPVMGHRRLPIDERAPGAPPVDWNVIRRIWQYTKPYAWKRNAVMGLTLARAVQRPALAWALALVINGAITRGDYRATIWGAVGYTLLVLFTGVVFHFRQKLSQQLGESVIHDIRNEVFHHLQQMPLVYFNKTKLGSILSRFISDMEAVKRGMQNVLFFVILLVGQMIGSAALMVYYNWVLFVLLLGITPIILLINRFFHPRLSHASRTAAESSSRLTGALAETVRGIRVIQGFTRQRRGEELFAKLVDRLAHHNVVLLSESSAYVPMLDFNSQIFLAVVLVVGGYGALHGIGGMQVGNIIAFLFLPNLFFQSLQQFGNLYPQILASMSGAERVFQILDLKPAWTDAPESQDLVRPKSNGKKIGDPANGAYVEFRNVEFAYEPDRPVLHGISFQAEPGQTVALVGHTGSGKTSIINLISKFYLPAGGEILIDGKNVMKLTGHSLRRQIGLVLQTNFLFTDTVLENIRFSKPEATDEEVFEAARALDCLDLLNHLPQGFQTQVGEGGTSISLGQRQLICFARALLANPRILILDEATSSVDTVTESRLQRALERLLQGRTSFVVAHRLSTIARADKILVLNQGQIAEQGTHLQLLQREGVYRNLYKQFALSDVF